MSGGSRAAITLVAVGLAALPVAAADSAGAMASSAPSAIGRALRIADRGPLMEPMRLPAALDPSATQTMAAVPGSHGEVWAVGRTSAPFALPGYDPMSYSDNGGGQMVFLHHTDAAGWQDAGPPLDTDGSVLNPSYGTAISMAANGEGWAAAPGVPGYAVVFLHKDARSTVWRRDDHPAPLGSGVGVAALSVVSDAQGAVTGFAVGTDGTPLALASGTWSKDTGSLSGAVAVAAVDGTTGWAVGGPGGPSLRCLTNPTTRCLAELQSGGREPQISYRDAGGWHTLQLVAGTPNVGAQGRAVTATATSVWIGGEIAVSGVDTQNPTAQEPWALHLHVGSTGPAAPDAATSYCANGQCDASFPETSGSLAAITTAGSDVFAAGGGLFHLTGGSGDWRAEPTAIAPLRSLAFLSPTEGWAARGRVTASGVDAAPVVGHWTATPGTAALRRWPVVSTNRFDAVASDPGGSGAALAAGVDGILRLDPASGFWVPQQLPAGTGEVRALSWPAPDQAWAVSGSRILRYDGISWSVAPVSGAVGGDLDAISVAAQPLLPRPASQEAPPPTLTPVITANPGAAASVAATLDAWGDGTSGQLGTGSAASSALPVSALGLPSMVQAAAGGGHSVALACPSLQLCAGTGRVWTWGDNTRGQLGAGTAGGQVVRPTQIGGVYGVVAVAAGGAFTLALTSDGHVQAWGANDSGQLGDGTTTDRATPAAIPALNNVVAIAAGRAHALAVDGNGTVWAWGANDAGQLGTGAPSPPSLVPVPVPGITGARTVSAGDAHSLALLSSGSVVAWGRNDQGQTGAACTAVCSTPVPSAVAGVTGATAIAAGGAHSLAVDGRGTVWAWGANGSGQLGTACSGSCPRAAQVPGLSGVKEIAAGAAHSLALGTDGSVWAWGDDRSGQVGDGHSAGAVTHPVRVRGIGGAIHVAAGAAHSLALLPGTDPSLSSGPGSGATSSGASSAAMQTIRGYAVGASGMSVRWDGTAWTVDPSSTTQTTATLNAVALAGYDAVAVGQNGTLLTNHGAGWSQASIPRHSLYLLRLGRDGRSHVSLPHLLAVAALPDGTVLVGGERSALLERGPTAPENSFALSELPPVEGAIHGLAASRDAHGALHAVADLGEDSNADPDSQLTASGFSGWMMAGDRSGWHDLELSYLRQTGLEPGNDPVLRSDGLPPQRDGVDALALDGSGSAGWAAGENGAIWRVDLRPGGPAASPMATSAALPADPGVGFAFIANTGCLQGSCSHQLGWGSRGDVVLMNAMHAIDQAAHDGRVTFVAGGGDLRRVGDVAALAPLPGLFDGLSVPFYAAPGAKDVDAGSSTGATAAWQAVFAGRPSPWGSGPAPTAAGIRPVAPTGALTAGSAATHYAFDYLSGGRAALRVVVMDTSTTPIESNQVNENPRESQVTWLGLMLQGATALHVPVIVVMNQLVVGTDAAHTGDSAVSTAVGTLGVAGILAADYPTNQASTSLVGGVPIGVFSSGGGRFRPTACSTCGAGVNLAGDATLADYNAWQLVTVATDPASGLPRMHVRSIPVLDSLAIGAPGGRSAAAGSVLTIDGLGRLPDVGRFDAEGTSDSEVTSQWLHFPFPRPCATSLIGGSSGTSCRSATTVPPDYHFRSDDPSILLPVREDPVRPGHPLLDDSGHVIPDDSSGVLCALRPGSTTVRLESGYLGARLPLSVTAGSGGECSAPVSPPPPAAPHPAAAAEPPHPPVVVQPHVQQAARARPLNQPPAVGAAVPPPVNVIPAPPGGSPMGQVAKQKEEESEAATEQANMTALQHRRAPDPGAGPLPWLVAGVATAAAAAALGGSRRRRVHLAPAPAYLAHHHPPGVLHDR